MIFTLHHPLLYVNHPTHWNRCPKKVRALVFRFVIVILSLSVDKLFFNNSNNRCRTELSKADIGPFSYEASTRYAGRAVESI